MGMYTPHTSPPWEILLFPRLLPGFSQQGEDIPSLQIFGLASLGSSWIRSNAKADAKEYKCFW